MVLKITRVSNILIGNEFEEKLSSEYFDVGFCDYTGIVMGNLKDIFISSFPIRYLLVVEFDIEYKPIYFLFRALYLISNVKWVCHEWCLH